MGEAEAVWLVAGGEPGAERFGQLVQRLRKEKQMSVDELADAAELSVGSIRAIEQARRAPSEESGVRLLRVLLPEDALSVDSNPTTGPPALRPHISFLDPESGGTILLKFKAKTAGDNRRWSSERPRASETEAEAFIRELMSDPERRAEWAQQFAPVFSQIGAVAKEAKEWAGRPADNDAFGSIVRRLAIANQLRMHYLQTLLDWWELVDSGEANDHLRDLVSQVQALLNSNQPFPVEDVP